MEDRDKIPGEDIEVSLDSRGEGMPEGQKPVEAKLGEEEHFGVEDSVIGTEVVKRKMSFGEWMENFWYHHKWHLIASLFIIAVLAVCITQCVMNSKKPADVKIIYAGSQTNFTKVSEDGSVPYDELVRTLSSLTRDYDENGERAASFEAYCWLSVDELEAIEKMPEDERPLSLDYIGPVVNESDNAISQLLVTNDYYVWLISDDLYEYLTYKDGSDSRFISLDTLAPDKSLPFYFDDDGVTRKTAVYLSELDVSELAGLDYLPEDTLVVLKRPTALDRNLTEYNNAKDFVKILLGVSE